jgi:cystathionine beta-lyase/cystathionine gamma-synthase
LNFRKFRLSIGIEPVDDLIADLDGAGQDLALPSACGSGIV